MSRLDLNLVAVAVGSRKSGMPSVFSDSLVHAKIVTGVGYKQIRSTYQPNQGFDCWFGPTEGRVTLDDAHGHMNQRWNVTTYTKQGRDTGRRP